MCLPLKSKPEIWFLNLAENGGGEVCLIKIQAIDCTLFFNLWWILTHILSHINLDLLKPFLSQIWISDRSWARMTAWRCAPDPGSWIGGGGRGEFCSKMSRNLEIVFSCFSLLLRPIWTRYVNTWRFMNAHVARHQLSRGLNEDGRPIK